VRILVGSRAIRNRRLAAAHARPDDERDAPPVMLPRTLESEAMDSADEADEYDAMDHRAANTAFVARLVQLGARGLMLDVGTGPGHLPILACDTIADLRVMGIDLSPRMIEHAERHRASSPHSKRLEFRVANARRLPFPDASFDALACNGMLHHLDDPRPLLEEARRVLKRRGALLVRDLRRLESDAEVDRVVATYAASASPRQRELFRASLHAAFTPNELRLYANDSGLREALVVVDDDHHVSLEISAS
jgi:ubiquinone/menaquinone biosynthesis C-methylase UbiE